MKSQSGSKNQILTQEDQAVSFAELFFDLVFVFSITQVVHLMHGHFDWVHVGRSMLVFWLVWWAWTQFTWALNAADTRHSIVQIGTLLATALAFFMAVSLPESFSKSSWYFAMAYVAVRTIGLLIYLWVTWSHPGMREAVKKFGTLSIAGLIAVLIGGYLGAEYQYWFWAVAVLLDVVAATIGGRSEAWNLFPRHFSERHGLFVIIALGETLIIAASAVTEEFFNGHLLIVSLLSVGVTCCLWWIYFYKTKDALEHSMASKSGSVRSTLARDVFSLLHFPLVCGLIIYAFAIEESMLHPDEAISPAARISLSVGILLYACAIGMSYWRATRKINFFRLSSILMIAALILGLVGIQTIWALSIAFGGLLLMCILEEFI